MKKFWKIFAITVGSIVGLALLSIVIAVWIVFTPSRLTPIVAKQLPRFVTCETAVDRVELTFFSSFPRLGLRIDGVRLVNPMEGVPCDTLARLERLDATVDVKAFLFRNELILSDIVLRDGSVCLFTDSLGRTNFDIVKSTPDPAADTTASDGFSLARIDVDFVTLDGLDVRYKDLSSPLEATLAGLAGTIKARMNGDDMLAEIMVEPTDVAFSMGRADSLLSATIRGLGLAVKATTSGDTADIDLSSLETNALTFAYGGEEYLKDARVSITAAASADLAAQSANIHHSQLTLNGLLFSLDGSVRNIPQPGDVASQSVSTQSISPGSVASQPVAPVSGTDKSRSGTASQSNATQPTVPETAASRPGAESRSDYTDTQASRPGTADTAPVTAVEASAPLAVETDLRYQFTGTLEELLALIPSAFRSYVDGISATGRLSSEGTIKGLYAEAGATTTTATDGTTETSGRPASQQTKAQPETITQTPCYPTVDAHITLEEGRVNYPSMVPYPVKDIATDIDLHTDLSDAASYVKINDLRATTPRSSIRARGTADRLFSDPHAALTADISGDLADVKPFIPESLNLSATGKISGRVGADVRMSQLATMALDKMRLSGSLLATDLDAIYDTIAVQTPSARLDFTLPNAKPSTRNTSFATASLTTDRLTAQMSDDTALTLDGMQLALETSNVLDTLNVPAVVCDFSMSALAARMDDMSAEIDSPTGRISMEPGRRNAAAQRIQVKYNSGSIAGKTADMTAVLDKLDIDATVMYDDTRADLWQKLSPRGYVDARGAVIETKSLGYPVEIPALVMDVTPRRFNVKETRVILDESDFSLRGTVDNIQPYFRGDSILRAEFEFTSPVTNVTQLLALTSGIGNEESAETETNTTTEIEAAQPDPAQPAADEFTGPYMVPQGIDITLHADIQRALWYASDPEPKEFRNIRGDVKIVDGVMLISPEISFESLATNGEIEIMYHTPRKNHLFAGVNIHLNHIEVQELLSLIPDLDSMMPMLRSFDGRGEFHASVEGYMDSLYNFKTSTLLGAGSLAAQELTLKDEETFRKIAFLLKYKDEGLIRVDSLRAEFTIVRDEVDVYPFLLSIDRYKAVISGRHNLDMSFDYNISLVGSPLPFRMAVDVKGTPDDLQFKVFSKSRYPDFYRPKYNGVVENRQMELRDIIRNSLLKENE